MTWLTSLPSFSFILGDKFIPYAVKLFQFIKGVFEWDETVLWKTDSNFAEIEDIFEKADSFGVVFNWAHALELLIDHLNKDILQYFEDYIDLLIVNENLDIEPEVMELNYRSCIAMWAMEENITTRNNKFNELYELFIERIELVTSMNSFLEFLYWIRPFPNLFTPFKNTNILSIFKFFNFTLDYNEIESILISHSNIMSIVIKMKKDKVKNYINLDNFQTHQDLELLKYDLNTYDELIHSISQCHKNIIGTLVDTTTNDFGTIHHIHFELFLSNNSKSMYIW